MGKYRLRQRIIAALLLVTLTTSVGFTATAHAADGFNLTVSPLPVNLTTKPGQKVTTPIRVQNSGTQAVRLKVSLMKFSADGATGSPALKDPTPQDAFIKWATFSQSSLVAQPGVFNTITMTISPPKSAAFGYYYAVVFSQDNGDQPDVPSQNKINGAVASLVLLDVQTNGEKRQLEAKKFTTERKLYQYLPADFTISVRNTGNIHVVPTGTVFIKRSGSNEVLATLPINSEQGNVLPQSNRLFNVQWNDGFPKYEVKRVNDQIISDKSGAPVSHLNWNLQNADKFRLGKYTASMTLVYSDGQRDIPVNGEVSFWVIPWLPFLVILVVIALLVVALVVLARLLIRKAKTLKKQ